MNWEIIVYLKSIVISVVLAMPFLAHADAVIFSGNNVKALKQNLDLNGTVTIQSGSVDPSSSSTSGNAGSLYLSTSQNACYVKQDAGASTNWTKLGAVGSLNGQTGYTQVFANDTNVKITSGTNTHTLSWSGTLALNKGGTGANLTAVNGGVFYSTGSAAAILAAGTSGQVLTSSGANTPSWATSGVVMSLNGQTGVTQIFANDTNIAVTSNSNTHTFGWLSTLALNKGGTGGNLTAIAGGIHYSTSSATVILPAGTSGQVLLSTGAGAPSWSFPYANPGTNNTFLFNTGPASPSGTGQNMGVGIGVLPNLTSGNNNFAFGYLSGNNLQTGSQNTMLGAQSGQTFGSSSARNVSVGYLAAGQGGGTNSSDNTLVGTAAANGLGTGSRNTCIGATCGNALTTSGDNVFVGYNAGYTNSVGSATVGKNIIIGSTADTAATTTTNAIGIGYGVSVASNAIQLGNSSNTSVKITPLNIAGGVVYSSATDGTLVSLAAGTSGQILTSTGSGAPSWGASTALTSLNGQTGSTQIYANDTNIAVTSSNNTHTFGWLSTLALNKGGTGANLSAVNGGIFYSTGSAAAILAAGTSGQVLLSKGAAIPSWGSATLAASSTDGQIYKSQGSTAFWSSYRDTPFAKNYIGNANAETDTTGWAKYADTAKNIPADATGGTATNLTFARNTSSPIRGSADFKLTQGNSVNIQGNGVSYEFTLDSADQAKALSVSFDYWIGAPSAYQVSDGVTAPLNDNTTTTNAGNSDIEVFIYDVTNAALIPVAPEVTMCKGAYCTFKGIFQTASNSTSYRFALHVATANSNLTGWIFEFSNVYVGDQPLVQGSPLTDWDTARAVTWNGLGTVANEKTYTRREGDYLHIRSSFTVGTAAASTASITMPSGVTIDSTKLNTISNGTMVGIYTGADGSARNYYSNGVAGGFVFYDGSDTAKVYFTRTGGATANTLTKENGSAIFSSSQLITVDFSVPVLGWSSTTQMSSDTDSRVVAASYWASASATGSTTQSINFDSKTYDTHGAVSAAAAGTGTWKFTAPIPGYYHVSYFLSGANGGSTTAYVAIYKNGTFFEYLSKTPDPTAGFPVGSGDILLTAGDYIDLRSNVSNTWCGNGGLASTTTCHVEIHKVSGNASSSTTDSVGFRYYASATSINGSLATISWTTKDWDTHGGMSSGTYTVQVPGKYQCNTQVKVAGTFTLNNTVILELQKTGTVVSRQTYYAAAAVTDINPELSDLVSVVAGDTLRVQLSSSGTSPSISASNYENYFSCHRVGN